MKKVFRVLSILSLITLAFSSCQDDNQFQELTEQVTAQSEPTTILTDDGQRKHRCASTEHTEKLLQNPDYRQQHELKFEKIKSVILSRSCASPTLLPVAVHYQGVSGASESCLRQLAQSQVTVLNEDYQGTNSDISIWNNTASSNFPGISNGEACLGFQIATQNHPSGYGLSNGDLAITINKVNGDFSADWSGYINIFVIPNTGYLGYAPLGGSGNGDGVVIDAAAFGKGSGCGSVSPQAPYTLGRTLTHEMGHYLLLDHIWGNGCGTDDGVADTPNSQQEYYDCPSIGQSSCSSTDMHMNYMDYVNDECMYMFSNGQASRMESYVASSLSGVVNNASNVLGTGNGGGDNGGGDNGGGDTATCDDGIQNGTETGVDCGGSCQPCETAEECTAPTSSNVQELSATSVKVTWNTIPDAIRYRIRYKEVGSSAWLKKSGTATQKTLSNLVAGATYEYQIRTRCSDQQWTPWNSKQSFTLGNDNGGGDNGGDGACQDYTLALTLDEYGSETSWEVEDETGAVVASGSNYQDFQDGETKNETFCLAPGCYTFVIYDAYGDGICCDYGDGSYEVKDANGNVIFDSNGLFGSYEATDFCVTQARQTEINDVRKDAKRGKRKGSTKRHQVRK